MKLKVIIHEAEEDIGRKCHLFLTAQHKEIHSMSYWKIFMTQLSITKYLGKSYARPNEFSVGKFAHSPWL